MAFLFEWLSKISKLHELSNLESDLPRYEEYLQFKNLVHQKSSPLPADVTDEYLYHLVHDFLKGNREQFLATFLHAIKEIGGKCGWR